MAGEYFIDRDSTYFHRILNYLRNGKLMVDELCDSELESLKIELDYYQIPYPLKKIFPSVYRFQWNTVLKSTNVEISKDNKSVQKSNNIDKWNAGALGTAPVPFFSVKIVKKSNGYITVGMAPQNID